MELEFQQLDRRYEPLRTRHPRRERRLLASLGTLGQQVPIVVVRGAEAERYVVVDGFKRIRALVHLRADTVLGTCWDLSESEALIVDRLLCGSERASALEQGWLLCELVERCGLSLDELARRFDRSVSWVSRRLGLVRDLPAVVQEGVRAGRVVAHVAMKYLLPLARANAVDCLALLSGIGDQRQSSRAMGRLYAAYVAGDARTRERLVANPLLFLRVDQELRRPPSNSTEQLLAELRNLLAVLARIRRRLRAEPLSNDAQALTAVLMGRCRRDFEHLGAAWPEESSDAGRVDTADHLAPAGATARGSNDCADAGLVAGSGTPGAVGGHANSAGAAATLAG